MNRGRGPQYTRSKAAPETLCQKCLQRGHYSYECKAKAQERPYIPRPSRTQQLLNPKLAPQLASDADTNPLRTNGLADELLAKIGTERARKRTREPDDDDENGKGHMVRRKRSRSASAQSSTSVSTMSTNLSRSPSPERDRPAKRSKSPARQDQKPMLEDSSFERKRRRSPSESSSESDRAEFSQHISHNDFKDRYTRRRLSSFSPSRRGRRRTRSPSDASMGHSPSRLLNPRDRRHRRHSRSRSRTRTYRDRVPRKPTLRKESTSPAPFRDGGSRHVHSQRKNGQLPPHENYAPRPNAAESSRHIHSRRERSPSPYSRRLALTQGMNVDLNLRH